METQQRDGDRGITGTSGIWGQWGNMGTQGHHGGMGTPWGTWGHRDTAAVMETWAKGVNGDNRNMGTAQGRGHGDSSDTVGDNDMETVR